MKVCLLIISNAKHDALYEMVVKTITTAIQSTESCRNTELAVYCSEGNHSARSKLSSTGFNSAVNIIDQLRPFNYNGELNRLAKIAIEDSNPDYLILANSDLVFYEDCIPKMVATMKKNEIHSASPYDPWVHGLHKGILPNGSILEGYGIRNQLTGWCIFISRKAYDIIGGLNEDVSFWFSDNIYADQLKKALISHALITNGICEHVGSQTLISTDAKTQDSLTEGERANYLIARKNIGAVFNPPLRGLDENVPTEPIADLMTRIRLLANPSLQPWQTVFIEDTIRWVAHQGFESWTMIWAMHWSKTQLDRTTYSRLWRSVKNRLPREHNWTARVMRLKLTMEGNA